MQIGNVNKAIIVLYRKSALSEQFVKSIDDNQSKQITS